MSIQEFFFLHTRLSLASFLHFSSILTAFFQHLSSILTASFQHFFSISPACLQHPSSIFPASLQHPSSILSSLFACQMLMVRVASAKSEEGKKNGSICPFFYCPLRFFFAASNCDFYDPFLFLLFLLLLPSFQSASLNRNHVQP